MKIILLFIFSAITLKASAGDDPKVLLRALNTKFNRVNDYVADVTMAFDIPGVKMSRMKGKVLFKRPNKFKIRTKGIFFLPRQNPMQNMQAMLLDSNRYTSIISGYEIVGGKNCAIVNIIPLKPSDELILGKFWVDVKNPLVLKSQITTRNNGTIEAENSYDTEIAYALPSKIVIRLETKKIKMSKIMSVDLNKKSKPKDGEDVLESGYITMLFSDYKINTKLRDEEFAADRQNIE
jgi:outer membrane lipoprotein-sorting protein